MKYIDEFLEYLTVVKKHSENTIINYKNDLVEFNNFTNNNLLNIEKNKVNSYLEYLYNQNASKSTISRKLSSLRTFYDYLVKKKVIEFNYFHQVKNPHKDLSLPKFVKEEDIDKMFEVPNLRTPISIRNNLIIHMLYSTGVRVSELVNIKLEDINQNEKTIRILGKGSKERIVIYGKNTDESLKLYLNSGRPFLGIHQSEYLFLNKDGMHLSDRYVRKIIDEIIFKGSIKMHVTPHMLRHTFATSMLNNGADLVNVKDLLGHESLNTTSIYTHVTDEKIKEIYYNAHPRA